jgi:hypothetical protein
VAAGSTNGVRPSGESGREKGLTCIPGSIHCGATPDTTEAGNELDQIAISHFLDTLAEIAVAVARRRIDKET